MPIVGALGANKVVYDFITVSFIELIFKIVVLLLFWINILPLESVMMSEGVVIAPPPVYVPIVFKVEVSIFKTLLVPTERKLSLASKASGG